MMEPTGESNIIVRDFFLQETFYSSKNKSNVRVKLTKKELTLDKVKNHTIKHVTVNLNDIIGCKIYRIQSRSDSCCGDDPDPAPINDEQVEHNENSVVDNSTYLWITAFVLKSRKLNSNLKREKVTITLRFRSFDKYEDNLREAQKWKSSINKFITAVTHSHGFLKNIPKTIGGERKIMVLLNPKSGSGKGREWFHRRVAPLLLEADVQYHLHITTHEGDARTIVRSMDLSQYCGGVVSVGGDGIIFEIINGVIERQDWEEALKVMRLGVVPCGSGNALAKSICHQINEPYDQDPILISTLNIIRGQTIPMNLVRVETLSAVMFSFLSVGWGLVADTDIESERLRALGGQRFAVWMIARFVGLRTYCAKLSFLRMEDVPELNVNNNSHHPPVASTSRNQENPSTSTNGNESCTSLDLDMGISVDVVGIEKLEQDVVETQWVAPSCGGDINHEKERSCQNMRDPEALAECGPPSALPNLEKPVPKEWTVCHGEFVMVHSMYKSHLAEDCLLAPASRLDDGIIWLCIIKAGISRVQLLQYLLGLSSGRHVTVPNTEMVPVRAFRLEPEDHRGCLTIDGERIPTGPVQVEMIPYTANVMARSV